MTVINPNSISGITSITLPSGDGNVLTIHTNDGVERFRIDSSGNVKVGSACTISQDGDVFFTGVCTATTLTGAASGLTGALPAISGANLTNLTAGNLTGALPAISGANLTGIAATDNVRTGILDVAGIATFRDNVNVGTAVTITSDGNVESVGVVTATALVGDFTPRNMLINGAMQVNQRGSGTLTVNSSSSQYPVDRWVSRGESSSKAFTIQQTSVSSSGLGIRNAVKVTSSQAASVGANDIFNFRQNIEGYTTGRLNLGESGCASMTLSFTVRSSVAGSHSGAIQNSAQNLSYPFTYTLVADTWTDVKITIPPITSGSFNETDGVGLRVVFDMGSGSSFRGTAGSWNSAQDEGATGAVRILETNGATWEITKVQLEEGTVATPFEKKLFTDEISACERYYYVMQANPTSYLPTTSDGRSRINRAFPTRMRSAPSGSMSNYTLSTKSDGVTGYQSSGNTDVLYDGTFDAEI